MKIPRGDQFVDWFWLESQGQKSCSNFRFFAKLL